MTTGLVRGVIFGLVIGLLFGFGGGFYYNGLSAGGPVAGNQGWATRTAVVSPEAKFEFTAEPGDQSGELGNALMAAIGAAIIDGLKEDGGGDLEAGIEKALGEDSSAGISLPKASLNTLGDKLFSKAQAQTGVGIIDNLLGNRTKGYKECTMEQVNASIDKVTEWYRNHLEKTIFSTKDSKCLMAMLIGYTASEDGKSVVEDTKRNIDIAISKKVSGIKSETFIGFSFKGNFAIKYKGLDRDDICDVLYSGAEIARSGGILITVEPGNPTKTVFVEHNSPGSGDGWDKAERCLRKAALIYKEEIANKNYTGEKCCDPDMEEELPNLQ
jgi:hypothetical protein